MYKLSYELPMVNRCLKLKVSVVYRDKLDNYKVWRSNFNGNNYLSVKTYPYFIMEITNDIEKREEWNCDKTMALTRFDMFKFIQMAQPLIAAFTSNEKLFMYDSEHKLHVNTEVANKKAVTVPLTFNKNIWISPVVVKEHDSNIEMEGVVMCFNTTTNYVTLTYDEFRFLVYYMDKVDIENISMQLLTYAEVTDKRYFNNIDKLPDAPRAGINTSADAPITGFNPVMKKGEIPRI